MVGESRHYDDTKPNQQTNILTYIQIKEALYERGSGSITFWVGVMWAVKLGWVGIDGSFARRFTPDLLFSPFLFLFPLLGAASWCYFSIPHGSIRSRGSVKIHPFFAGISWRVSLCFGFDSPVWDEMGWWEGRTGGADGVPWEWSSDW